MEWGGEGSKTMMSEFCLQFLGLAPLTVITTHLGRCEVTALGIRPDMGCGLLPDISNLFTLPWGLRILTGPFVWLPIRSSVQTLPRILPFRARAVYSLKPCSQPHPPSALVPLGTAPARKGDHLGKLPLPCNNPASS